MLIGGGQTAPDWAAFYNGALVLIEKARSKRVRGSQADRATGELTVGYLGHQELVGSGGHLQGLT